MPKREKTHYNMDKIDEEGAQINLIYGERSNGKSYQLKHKKAVLQYLFGGLRDWLGIGILWRIHCDFKS